MEQNLCPHCGISIEIEQVNCAIFRCGIYKKNYQQINPHMPKEEYEKIKDDIYGCGQPFQLHNDKLIKCAWI